MNRRKNILLKDKWTIFLKYYNCNWKPYFHSGNKIHCFDYDYAKKLYDNVCENFNTSQWMLIKIDNMYSRYEFMYIKEDD